MSEEDILKQIIKYNFLTNMLGIFRGHKAQLQIFFAWCTTTIGVPVH
jgi:hypothetical protein